MVRKSVFLLSFSDLSILILLLSYSFLCLKKSKYNFDYYPISKYWFVDKFKYHFNKICLFQDFSTIIYGLFIDFLRHLIRLHIEFQKQILVKDVKKIIA